MNESLKPALDELQARLQTKLNEAAEVKKAINVLYGIMGMEPAYPDVEAEKASGLPGPARSDIYYNKPLSAAVRDFLELRKQPVRATEILKALEQGNFDFDEIGWSPTIREKNLALSLAKNTAMFKKMPNGEYGLKAWYIKPGKKAKAENGQTAEAESETGSAETATEPDAKKATA
jgi:hypothetical protein